MSTIRPNEHVEPGTRVRHKRLQHEGEVVRQGVVREVVHVLYDGHKVPVITAKRVLDRL